MQIDEKVRQQLEQSILPLHVQEIEFIMFCRKLRFGTIEKLAIQNGVPCAAVNIAERIDFTKGEGFERLRIALNEQADEGEQDETRNRGRRGRGSN